MTSFSKFILAAFLAIAVLSTPALAAPKALSLGSPLDASHYAAGATAVMTISLLSIDYQNGVYRFQLLDSTGTAYNGGAVYGVNVANPSEANAQADITAAIEAAH
jgi:hypothetical protein